ncbi:RNA polymerase sigma factor [Bacillaceae bacterium IKA-2]|nr:RNA polymerase sigma factor [Bacillaceae bacterium IKA-2]
MSNEKKRETDIGEWYEVYGDAIFKYILMMVQDYQQAEDLTQETFIKAYRFYDTFNYHSTRKTWLFSVARNTTIDYLRKRKPFEFIKEFFLHNKRDVKPSPDEFLVLKENAQELYAILKKMKSSYKEVILLRKVKGFTIKETSEVLHWSEGKVKTTLSRALTDLKSRLAKEGYSHETKF